MLSSVVHETLEERSRESIVLHSVADKLKYQISSRPFAQGLLRLIRNEHVRSGHRVRQVRWCDYTVAPPGFRNGWEVRYGSIGGLGYEVPQSRLYCLCINVALCSTALQCIFRVIRRSSMTTKAHTYYIIFGRPPIGGSCDPWRRHSDYTIRYEMLFALVLRI